MKINNYRELTMFIHSFETNYPTVENLWNICFRVEDNVFREIFNRHIVGLTNSENIAFDKMDSYKITISNTTVKIKRK